MLTVQKRTLDLAIRSLQALGAQYIIKDADGNLHQQGELTLGEPTKVHKRKKRCLLPRGQLSRYVESYMNGMQPGDVRQLPATDAIDMKTLHSAVSSYGTKTWGAGNLTTHRDRAGNCIEVLRVM